MKNSIDKDELYNLRINKCWTFDKLALHFNVSRQTIFSRCKEYNFPKVLQDNKNHIWKRDGGFKNVKS
jgi:predicted transcriptional regulator